MAKKPKKARKWAKPKTSDRNTVFRTLRLRPAEKLLIQNLAPYTYPPQPGRKTRQEVFHELIEVVKSLQLPVRKIGDRELMRLEFPLDLFNALRDKSDDTNTEEADSPWPTNEILVIAAHEYAKQHKLEIPAGFVSPLEHFGEMSE